MFSSWTNIRRNKPGAKLFRERGLREKSAADTLGLFEWRMRADVFQSFPRRKFCQSASDPPRTDADCRGINLVCRVRGGFRIGNFHSAKNKICRIPRRRQSDPLAPTRTQADSIGVRRGIVPPPRLPNVETLLLIMYTGSHLKLFTVISCNTSPYILGTLSSPYILCHVLPKWTQINSWKIIPVLKLHKKRYSRVLPVYPQLLAVHICFSNIMIFSGL